MDTDRVSGAFADEVRAEMARQRVTARAMQDAVGEGLSSSAYQKYFVQKTRAIPSDVQLGVCRALGVKVSEMWRRAEESVTGSGDPITDELRAGLMGRGARRVADELAPVENTDTTHSEAPERPTRHRRSS